MKKIVSLITAVALVLQLGLISAFAVPTPDKTLFKDTSEIFGVYDCSFANLSILQVDEDGLTPYVRDLSDIEFYDPSDFSFSFLNYQLSSDKKSVTAYFTAYVEGVQYQGRYVFNKDASGNVYFKAQDYQDNYRNIYKTYDNATELFNYIEGPGFNRVLLSEKALLKKLNTINTQIEKKEAGFEDSKPISSDNYLDGFYPSPDKSQYLNFYVYSDYNTKNYSDLNTYTRIVFTVDAKSYYLSAKSFIVKNGVATYLENSKNYMEITASSRSTISNVKIVKNGKIIVNQKVSLTLSK